MDQIIIRCSGYGDARNPERQSWFRSLVYLEDVLPLDRPKTTLEGVKSVGALSGDEQAKINFSRGKSDHVEPSFEVS